MTRMVLLVLLFIGLYGLGIYASLYMRHLEIEFINWLFG